MREREGVGRPIGSSLCLLFFHRVVYPGEKEMPGFTEKSYKDGLLNAGRALTLLEDLFQDSFKEGSWVNDGYDSFDEPLATELFPLGRFGLKAEGGGKTRVFSISKSIKQTLLRPAHNWSMSVLSNIRQDGTFDQYAPLSRLKGLRSIL
jgi:hypothetical protein